MIAPSAYTTLYKTCITFVHGFHFMSMNSPCEWQRGGISIYPNLLVIKSKFKERSGLAELTQSYLWPIAASSMRTHAMLAAFKNEERLNLRVGLMTEPSTWRSPVQTENHFISSSSHVSPPWLCPSRSSHLPLSRAKDREATLVCTLTSHHPSCIITSSLSLLVSLPSQPRKAA